MLSSGYISHTEVEKTINQFIGTLGPEVVRVRWNFGNDWMGDPVLYFRIILADSVSGDVKTFLDTAKRVRASFWEQLQPLENWGLFPHINFRSNAENTPLNDPKWT